MVGEEHAEQTAQRAGEAGGEFVLAEGAERKGIQPVMERWFFKILDIIKMGGDEIAKLQHFPGNLRIAALVGVDEGESAKLLEKCHGEGQKQQGDVPPGTTFAAGQKIGEQFH